MLITSRQNEIIKRAKQLLTAKGRAESGLHLIEGEKMISEAVGSGWDVEQLFVLEDFALSHAELVQKAGVTYFVTCEVLSAVCDTKTPQGVAAALRTPGTEPPADYPGGLLVALDGVGDPGNLGTIIRSADAMGASGVLAGEGCADVFSPKSLRAAMGSTYHLPVWQGNLHKELLKLKEANYTLIAGHLGGRSELPELDTNVCLVIGSEAHGISKQNSELCYLYKLKMPGRAESLNASVAAGILLYQIVNNMSG